MTRQRRREQTAFIRHWRKKWPRSLLSLNAFLRRMRLPSIRTYVR